ncbi:hypothetical protein GDO78_016968 [Eleutherodactylus coqui]|uniref:C2H2-type domain-containing protein n=1 Tax=Eleutherodactylus coqui TaxID=57060 RepID=A0A8J6E872_ELECQ|nr:hypothetical protein GDO78_016968 [Eleutherodactylus coqui]
MEETASCDEGTSADTNTNATSDHPQQQHHMKGEPATQEKGALPAPDMGTLAARTQHPATGIKEESVSRGAGNSTATNTDCPSTPSIKAPVTPERGPPGPTGHAQQYPSTPTMGEPVSWHAGNITGSNIYSSAQPAVSLEGEHLYNNYGYVFTEHTYTHPNREALRYGAASCAEDCIDSLPHTVGASTSVGGFSTEARLAELQYVSNHVRSPDSCPAQAERHHAFLSKCLEYENHFCKVSCAGICGTHLTEWAFNCSECHNCLNATLKLIRQSPKPPQVKRKSAKKTSSLEKKEFACLECGKHFPNKRYLLTHRRVHSQESPFHCPACGQSFQNQEGFVAHQRSPACEKPFCCSECGKRFKSRYNSEYHKKIHTENKKYLCPVCGKGFRKQSCFIVHERTHTGEKPYACPECGRCFSQNASLLSHQRLHTGEKPFTCLECGRNFTQRISLVVHQRVHSGDRPYKCQECGKGFTQRIGLVQHQRRHTGEKPFTCSECGKSFTLHDSLVKHLRTHTGEKPYVCSECGKRFCQSSQLTAHKRFHHATRHNV